MLVKGKWRMGMDARKNNPEKLTTFNMKKIGPLGNIQKQERSGNAM
jgi:hypothetical protein